MSRSSDPINAHERDYWLRHDAHRFIRHDVKRFLKPGTDPADVYPALARQRDREEAAFKAQIERGYRLIAAMRKEVASIRADLLQRRLAEQIKYSPTQPRMPAGNPRGGQWTDRSGGGGGAGFGGFGSADGEGSAEGTDGGDGDGGSSGSSESSIGEGINDPRVISDADPEGVKPGEQYAQAGGRRSGTSVRINGQIVEVSPRQEAELQGVQARAEGAIARVRELDPNWKPTPSAYESVDGLIRKYRADAQQAQDRASELGKIGIGPGPFAGESISARGPERNFTAAERREINRIGSETGCHTCGTLEPETKTGNFVIDHQVPNALNEAGRAQRLYPQCVSCSVSQGGRVGSLKGLR
jgi:hypothetical protein